MSDDDDDSKNVPFFKNKSGKQSPVAPVPPIKKRKFKKDNGRLESILKVADEKVDIDYLLEGILLKGYLYLMTGPTGSGKTAIALLMALSVMTGRDFGGVKTQKGKVLYLAGENPLDVQMRLIAGLEQMGIDAEEYTDDFDILRGVDSLDSMRIHARNNRYSLIIVDTFPAFFPGDDINSNDQVRKFTHNLIRPLCELDMRPVVLALCHPLKTPTKDKNIPYGGGALLNECDGNLAVWDASGTRELYTCGKFRGPEFEPLNFRLDEVTSEKIKDNQGKKIPTVLAAHVTEEERERAFKKARYSENDLMSSMIHHSKMTMAKRAVHLGWFTRTGNPAVGSIHQKLIILEKDKLAGRNRWGWFLTKRGREAAHGIAEGEAY